MSNVSIQYYIELVLLSAVWGLSFIFMRIASPALGPIFLVEVRVVSALFVMVPLLVVMKKHQELIDNWKMVCLLGFINMAVPFCLVAFAALNASAALLSILNVTLPFFTALLGFFLFGRRLTLLKIAGMVVGAIGVIVVVADPEAISGGAGNRWAVPAALFSCFLYGLALNLVDYKMQGVSGLTITAGSLLVSSVLLFPLAVINAPEVMPGLQVWGSVLTLGIVCTGLAYMHFYRLVARIGSHQAIMITYLIPVFSILWGSLFLGESITLFTIFGCILALLGVGMSTGGLPGFRKKKS